MRSVSARVCRGVALPVLLTLVLTAPAFADDPPAGTAPPQGRIQVPVGTAAEAEPPSIWELFVVWIQGRIQVPVG
jgi:hypothetical protein